jgi:hypothetical protein
MHKKNFLSNRDPQVSLNKLLTMSLVVCLVALAAPLECGRKTRIRLRRRMSLVSM